MCVCAGLGADAEPIYCSNCMKWWWQNQFSKWILYLSVADLQ